MLPYEATRSLNNFLDAVSSYLRFSGAAEGQDAQSYFKVALLQLGAWFLSEQGRRLWTQYFASLLYTFETLFKQRVAVALTSSGSLVPPTWNLPTYSTGVSQSVSDGPVADVLPEGIFSSDQEQHTTRKDRTQEQLVQSSLCNVLGTMAGQPKSSAILSNGTWGLYMLSHSRHAKIKFALRCRRLVLMPKHLKTSELSHARSRLLLRRGAATKDESLGLYKILGELRNKL